MYCSNCGAEFSDDANNCPSCGTSCRSNPDPRYYAAVHAGSPEPTYLVQSILVTIFCCQIFGIVAIVFSAIAMGKNSSGDYEGARRAAGNAKMWGWIGFGIGLVIFLAYIALMVLGVAASSTP